jgi:MYXO-CTERM domain-containing protein
MGDGCLVPSDCDPGTGACSYTIADEGDACEGGSCESGVCIQSLDAVAAGGAGGAPPLIEGSQGGDDGLGGEGGSDGGDVGDDEGERGRLVPRPASGCACRTGGTGGGEGLPLWAALVALGLVVVRRERRRP